jgi:hypothetical protein
MTPLNPALPKPPARIARLPRDHRGFPTPFFVTWFDTDGKRTRDGHGRPDFRVIDPDKIFRCYRKDLCWICGERLGVNKAFVIGPMCAINRTTQEPPSHYECAQYAVRACPFLSFPNRKRDERGVEHLKGNVSGIMLARNPGVSLIWVTKTYQPFRAHAGNDGVLFRVGDPQHVEWWRETRRATRDEVRASIDSGLPALLAHAPTRADRDEIANRLKHVELLLPT